MYATDNKKPKKAKEGNVKERKVSKAKIVGLVMCAIQLLATMVFIITLLMLNVLPMNLLLPALIVPIILWLIPLIIHLIAKKKAIFTKIISVFMSVIMIIGSVYIIQGRVALGRIAGGRTIVMIDTMVVVVLYDDPAETLQDAADYTFGVQRVTDSDNVEATVTHINNQLDTTITEVEYDNLLGAAQDLLNGEVGAIIYNAALTELIEEAYEGFSNAVRVIYSFKIRREIDNPSRDVSVRDDSFAIFISGIDTHGPIQATALSDVNLLMVINPTTHQILSITTPRDYFVRFPGVTGEQRDKLTHAGAFGIDVSVATIAALYDIDIPFYVRMNFTSFVRIIDALGGIDVYSTQAFNTQAGTSVRRGMNRFNGAQALAFSRERNNVTGGDFQRGRNHQAVLTATLNRMMSPAILTGFGTIMDSVGENVDTNMTLSQIQSLVRGQLDGGASWNIKSMDARGTGIFDYGFAMPGVRLYFVRPDMDSINEIKEQIAVVQRGGILVDADVIE
ncbi:MAG: LCP family protein [Oscillospiraceae bacterium]|nr:LCP family protein [Oscillospiraceae bacterium]